MPVLGEVRDGVVSGLGVRPAAGEVHREAHLAVAREVLDIDSEEACAREVERAAALRRVEAQPAGPLGARHAEDDGVFVLLLHLRAVHGAERAGGEGEGGFDGLTV